MTKREGKTTGRFRLSRGKLWLDVVMVLLLVVLAVVLYRVTPEQTQLAPIFEDLELLAAAADPGFYHDVEFYQWLERQHEK